MIPFLILLEFNTDGNQQTDIRVSNELRYDFKKVYINPDKTLNERNLDKKFRKVRRNSKFTSVHPDISGRHINEMAKSLTGASARVSSSSLNAIKPTIKKQTNECPNMPVHECNVRV